MAGVTEFNNNSNSKESLIVQIRKRDGRVLNFESSKIVNATYRTLLLLGTLYPIIVGSWPGIVPIAANTLLLLATPSTIIVVGTIISIIVIILMVGRYIKQKSERCINAAIEDLDHADKVRDELIEELTERYSLLREKRRRPDLEKQ